MVGWGYFGLVGDEMSYCRYDGESEAYIYAGKDAIYCCMCRFSDSDNVRDFEFKTRAGVLRHVARHRAAGHNIPFRVDQRLRREIKEIGNRVGR